MFLGAWTTISEGILPWEINKGGKTRVFG